MERYYKDPKLSMEGIKTLSPIRIPHSAGTCWVAAHQHLIASYIEWDDFLFIILHSGHHLLGYTSEAGWLTYEDEEVYPEWRTPEYWAEEMASSAARASVYPDNRQLADAAKWMEAIRDIPELYAYYEPY